MLTAVTGTSGFTRAPAGRQARPGVSGACRQVVYDSSRHTTSDGVTPSETDAYRMLEAYVSGELAGGANERVRRHPKAALDLANELQHRRTADYRLAALCVAATTSVINLVAIISGRRDREGDRAPPNGDWNGFRTEGPDFGTDRPRSWNARGTAISTLSSNTDEEMPV